MKLSILIIDDEDKIRRFLGDPFTRRGHRVYTAGTGRQGLDVFRKEEPDIIILDMKLPDMDGMQVLREIRQASPEHIVIMITAYGEIRLAVEAMKLGAFDYLTKPFEFDAINIVIEKAAGFVRMRNEITCLKRENNLSIYEDMVGKSKRMQEVFRRIEEVAESPAPLIFLNGETGTGKELAARAIHRISTRAAGPFVALNCTILDERLLQSELFGHEKGAFTDATETKKGLFEVADGGTIFLDEIGDITPMIQAKLLRVLEEKNFRRLGGTKDIFVNIRIIISTNRDLKAAVAAGQFREDLYFRINALPLEMPPLRNRGEDILLLMEYFIRRFNLQFGKNVQKISPQIAELFSNYPWPGNVRELKNVIERMVLLSKTEELFVKHVPHEIFMGNGAQASPEKCIYYGKKYSAARDEALNSFERGFLVEYLTRCEGNVSKSATVAEMNRSSFQRMMKKHQIASESFRLHA
jgi:DNA-binding NtrC family response regulator